MPERGFPSLGISWNIWNGWLDLVSGLFLLFLLSDFRPRSDLRNPGLSWHQQIPCDGGGKWIEVLTDSIIYSSPRPADRGSFLGLFKSFTEIYLEIQLPVMDSHSANGRVAVLLGSPLQELSPPGLKWWGTHRGSMISSTFFLIWLFALSHLLYTKGLDHCFPCLQWTCF